MELNSDKAEDNFQAQKELMLSMEFVGGLTLKKSKKDLEREQEYHQQILEKERTYKRKNQNNLDDGRKKGTEERKIKARRKKGIIEKAIKDLFADGEGWKMTNDEIATHLIEKEQSTYRYGSTMNIVKKIAAEIRSAKKRKQA